jgi:hypothetical protein
MAIDTVLTRLGMATAAGSEGKLERYLPPRRPEHNIRN